MRHCGARYDGRSASSALAGSKMPSSSFSGLFTRVLIGHMRISSDGNGTNRPRGSGSMLASQGHRRQVAGSPACGRVEAAQIIFVSAFCAGSTRFRSRM